MPLSVPRSSPKRSHTCEICATMRGLSDTGRCIQSMFSAFSASSSSTNTAASAACGSFLGCGPFFGFAGMYALAKAFTADRRALKRCVFMNAVASSKACAKQSGMDIRICCGTPCSDPRQQPTSTTNSQPCLDNIVVVTSIDGSCQALLVLCALFDQTSGCVLCV